jgi:O-methyltransferase
MGSGQTSSAHVESVWKIRLAKSGLQGLRSTLTFVSGFSLKGFDASRHSVVIPEAFVSPWKTDRSFVDIYSKIHRFTTVDVYRCYELWHLLGQVINLGGDVLEVGVWRGGTGCLLAAKAQSLTKNAAVFLCDTFTGVVKAGELDNFYKGGEHADTSKAIVAGLANSLGLDKVKILEGIFPDETGKIIEGNKICFCHIDVDVYQSAKDVINWVWPRLQVGGIIVFDDYGFHHCQGITQLVDELATKSDNLMLNNLNGHAVLIRRE